MGSVCSWSTSSHTSWDYDFLSFQVTYFHHLSSDISSVDVFRAYLEAFPSVPHHTWESRKCARPVSLSLEGKLRLLRNRGTPAAKGLKKDTPP